MKSGLIPEHLRENILRELLKFLSDVDYETSPPALGRQLQRILRKALDDPDPYRSVKDEHNQLMLSMYDKLRDNVLASANPFNTAMRLAIAGNVIDFGSHHRLDVLETIDRVLTAKLAIDHSEKLQKELKEAGSVLYIGDNA